MAAPLALLDPCLPADGAFRAAVSSPSAAKTRPASRQGRHLALRRDPIRHIRVCIPARNEAARFPAMLDAMAAAVVRAQRSGLGVELVVLLDGCTDDSRAFLSRAARHFPCRLRTPAIAAFGTSHAGRARRAAMEDGMMGVTAPAATALLTTDADTRVDADWIVASAAALADADLVAGMVDWDDETPVPELTRQERYFDRLHRHRRRIDPVAHDAPDPHHKCYGASLGVRAGAYRAVGGLPERPSSEDVALCNAIRLGGFRMRQDRSVRVLTSTRRRGRAQGGFSDAILSVEHQLARGEGLRVDCPKKLTEYYQASARLRRAFEQGLREDTATLANMCGDDCVGTVLPEFELEQAWASAPSADAFVTRLLDPLPAAPRVRLEEAEAALSELEARSGSTDAVRGRADCRRERP